MQTVQPQLLQHSGYSHNCTNQLLQPQLSLYGSGYSHNCPAFKGPLYATMLTKRATVFRKIYELSFPAPFALIYVRQKRPQPVCGHQILPQIKLELQPPLAFQQTSWRRHSQEEPRRTTAAKVKPGKTTAGTKQAEAAAGVNFHGFLRQNMKQGHWDALVSVKHPWHGFLFKKCVYTGKAMRMNHQHRLLSKQIHLQKINGRRLAKTPAYAVFVPYLCMCAFGVVNPWAQHCKKQVVLFCASKKKSLRTWMWHYCVPERFHTCMIDDVFSSFSATKDQTPNTFSNLPKGWSVNWKSKNMETQIKTAYLCQKNMRKTAWFCSTNHEKPWKNISINILDFQAMKKCEYVHLEKFKKKQNMSQF